MSLDVSLIAPNRIKKAGTGVFVRENGRNVELLTSDEVYAKFGQRVPEVESDTNCVFDWNITHNLGEMADQVKIDDHTLYQYLWRPEEIGVFQAKQLIEPLSRAWVSMLSDREKLEEFNPENGWGDYEGLVNFVEEYLKAAVEYPDATIEVSR